MTTSTEHFGDLKMVKVTKRGRRGRKKSRSLVFRISRTVPKNNCDDYQDSLNSEEPTANAEESVETCNSPIKLKIPKIVLHNIKTEKDNPMSPKSSENIALQNRPNRSSDAPCLFTSQFITTKEDVTFPEDHNQPFDAPSLITSQAIIKKEGITLQNDPNQSSDTPGLLTSEVTTNEDVIFRDDFNKFSDTSSLFASQVIDTKEEYKYSELRRSSRRIVFRMPKVCPPVFRGGRRKRGRRPGTRNGIRNTNSKVLLKQPNNSVWTLVPKELFESEYFKSQVLKVRFCNPRGRKSQSEFTATAPGSFSPTISAPSTSYANNERVQFRSPKSIQTNLSRLEQHISKQKDYKRPTVIYFNAEKKNIEHSQEESKGFRGSLLPYSNRMCNTQSDLAYLTDKYHMLDKFMVTEFYELSGSNLNEAEEMLMDFLSKNRMMSSENGFYMNGDSNLMGSSIGDFNQCVPAPYESFDFSGLIPSLDVGDTLTRQVIVDSLRILFDEEAILS